MIVRDPWTTAVGPYYGTSTLGDLATDPQVLYEELHATAIALNQAQQRLLAATTADARNAEAQNIANLRAHFQNIRQRFIVGGNAQDPQAVTKTDRVVLAIGDVLASVPSATGAVLVGVVRPMVDATADLLMYVGTKTIAAALPFGVLAIGAVALLLFAEKSRIVRRIAR